MSYDILTPTFAACPASPIVRVVASFVVHNNFIIVLLFRPGVANPRVPGRHKRTGFFSPPVTAYTGGFVVRLFSPRSVNTVSVRDVVVTRVGMNIPAVRILFT